MQVREVLDYLNALGGTLFQKVRLQAETERTVPYPYEAMEEAIVNAIYHRAYESPPEPVKVYLYPDRMEIISYPGPVAGIRPDHFTEGRFPPAVPARNRRVGEFLKELRLAESRGTGIPKIQRRMRQNGSPEARFDFDAERTYFRVVLPVHPRYEITHALREAAHLWAIGERASALDHLRRTFNRQPGSGALASQIIEYAFALDAPDVADQTLQMFESQPSRSEASRPYTVMAGSLIDRGDTRRAIAILKRTPPSQSVSDTIDTAILHKRAGNYRAAHPLFAQAYSAEPDDPQLIHEFAQTKLGLARGLRPNDPEKRRLNNEAAELLRRAIQLSADPVRQAWCWFDLAGTLEWLRAPTTDVEAAFLRARALLPEEMRFQRDYQNWKSRAGRRVV